MNGVLLLGEGLGAVLGPTLEELEYAVNSVPSVASVDDIAAAIIVLKERASAGIGAVAIGPAATLLLDAATVLPQLDAVAVFAAKLPAGRVHYDRMRVQVQVHRAEHGKAMSEADLQRLRVEAAPGHVMILDWSYATTNDRFIVEPRGERDETDATIATDRVRDFMQTALPDPYA